MVADGFASLSRADAGLNVVFLRRGLATLPADQRDEHASGLILAFTVDDLEGELARLQAAGVAITMPLTVEEWGERAFQVRDPNGVIVQLVDWQGAPAAEDQWPSGRGCEVMTGWGGGLRDGEPGDADELTALLRRSRAVAMPWLATPHDEAATRWWIAHVVLAEQRVRVAQHGERIVGFSAVAGGSTRRRASSWSTRTTAAATRSGSPTAPTCGGAPQRPDGPAGGRARRSRGRGRRWGSVRCARR
ncbi:MULTISPECIES: VOC family protein [unclassified Modestobacter]